MLKSNTEAIYELIERILQAIDYQEDKQRRVKDSWIFTTLFIGAKFFSGNLEKARDYILCHHCPEMLGKSRFNRRVHMIEELSWQLFEIIGFWVKSENATKTYLLDTFPVPVCQNIRVKRSKIIDNEVFRGKSASKRVYFYGFKVAVITTEDGIPVELCFMPGSFSDVCALNSLPFELEAGSSVYGDSGFTDYTAEDALAETQAVELKICRKKNSLRGDDFVQRIAKNQLRKYIETAFSVITNRFPKKIHAVTARGFLLKLLFFVFLQTIDCAYLKQVAT